ncbi:hypothetical protein Zm00014a_029635 [Zea mays]|uniref:Uncharacterized protein n=1 Tax=Zea mays TaxID=4577 RepID=A0A3L6G9I2_MAIZE|nr:hypothetical protein Zm00014a_029635 [Zea mays]
MYTIRLLIIPLKYSCLWHFFSVHIRINDNKGVFVWDYNLPRLYNPTTFELTLIWVNYNPKQTTTKYKRSYKLHS